MPENPTFPDLSLPESDPFDNMPPWAQMAKPGAGGRVSLAEPPAGQRRAWIVIAPARMGMALVGLADRAAHQAEMMLRDLEVQVVSPDSKLASPGLMDFGADFADADQGADPREVGRRVRDILGHLPVTADDIKLTVTDLKMAAPAGVPFLLWHAVEEPEFPNNVIVSTHYMDPATWGDPMSEEARRAAIEQRLTAAMINIMGVMLGYQPCHDPECYLYRPIERVRRLDYMRGFVGVHADLLNTRLSPEQEQRLREELEAHKAVLNTLELQRTRMGDYTPPYILLSIEETKKQIRRIERQLDEALGGE